MCVVKVTMLLADHAQVADGKLNIIGGGWSITGPVPGPSAIAMLIQVPWDQTNQKQRMRLELVDSDGVPVAVDTPEGRTEVVIEGEFEAGRPVGLKPGTPIDMPVAIDLPPQPIPPGGRYEWRLSINDRSEDDWTLAFSTRPDNAAQAV